MQATCNMKAAENRFRKVQAMGNETKQTLELKFFPRNRAHRIFTIKATSK